MASINTYAQTMPQTGLPAGATVGAGNVGQADETPSTQQDRFVPTPELLGFLLTAAAHFAPGHEDNGPSNSQSVAAHTTTFPQAPKRKASNDDDAASVGETPPRKRSRDE